MLDEQCLRITSRKYGTEKDTLKNRKAEKMGKYAIQRYL